MSSHERVYYEQAGLWSGETAASHDVVAAVLELWPDDVRSTLDVGCGDGAITNFLVSSRPIVGGDFSLTALRGLDGPAVALSADALPFADGTFDMTMATDVIEHLPDAIIEQSIRELVRVSRKYVLICVPQHEPADYFRVDCKKCATRFHAHHHQRGYDIADFAGIEGTSIAQTLSVGSRWALPSNRLAAQMRDWTVTSYDFPLAVCPACGTVQGEASRSDESTRLERRFEAMQYLLCETGVEPPPCRSELAVLLVKETATSEAIDTLVQAHDPAVQRVAASESGTAVIDFAPDRRREALETFPDDWTWVADGANIIVVVPRSPARLEVTMGDVNTAMVYDVIDERYLSPTASVSQSFDLPVVRPDARGYRILLGAIDPASTQVTVSYRTASSIEKSGSAALLAFESPCDTSQANVHDATQPLSGPKHRITDLEAALDRETERADTNAQRVTELYDQLQTVADEREKLNELANSLEARRAELERRRWLNRMWRRLAASR